MSYKLPIIASDIAANKEVLDDDKALWCKPEDVVSLKNAIETAINNPQKFYATVDVNFAKVHDNYTWQKVAEKYIKYLESIV